jgi:hypothetical protein
LSACTTNWGPVRNAQAEPRTEFVEPRIERALFTDSGAPDTSLPEGADQAKASDKVYALGEALMDYRCRLNAAGVALNVVVPLDVCRAREALSTE